MKKFFAIIFLFAIVSSSCTKEYQNPTTDKTNTGNNGSGGNGGGGGGNGGGGGGGNTIGPVPTSFTQKILIEEFTGEWCGYCPDGALKVKDAENAFPGVVYGAAVHNGDPYAIALDGTLESTFGLTGYPEGMVNRVPYSGSTCMDRSWWQSAASAFVGGAPNCGLAITSYTSGIDSVYVTVHCGFNATMSGDYRLTVYILEDGILSQSQHNYYNTPGAQSPDNPALNNIGDPINNWTHNDVVRKVLTADLGDPIPASKMVAGGDYVIKYGNRITGYNKANVKIYAFINKVGTDAYTHQVINIQKAKLYEIKNWN